MVDFLVPLLIAILLGFLAGMGVGGGSLLLLWLTQVVGMPQSQARILNLLFFLPAAITATLFRVRKQLIPPGVILPALLTGCTAAAVFTLLARFLDIALMKKLLGGLLILVGLREIFYRPRKAK